LINNAIDIAVADFLSLHPIPYYRWPIIIYISKPYLIKVIYVEDPEIHDDNKYGI
jgi:hypothetical protein